MQSFHITTGPPQGQKNFVFVDEHNRHKRLKVMRACEGCRRRKIKCDSATTNQWPCAACVRLKLHCVPPVTGNEGEQVDISPVGGPDGRTASFDSVSNTAASDIQPYNGSAYAAASGSFSVYQPSGTVFASNPGFQKGTYAHVEDFDPSHPGAYGTTIQIDHEYAGGTQTQAPIHAEPGMYRIDSANSVQTEQSTAEDLSEHLGDLKIGENGIAPYLRAQEKVGAEPEAPIQEQEEYLPPLRTEAGSQIRIPPALMPSDEDALHHFQTFFKDVHPYVPVLSRNFFYHQWHSDRSAISPLLLEAVFACAGRITDQPAGGSQWLALASRHEECFLDTPRLSTIQALLILMKAREGAQKRGYYYRSWMTCKTIVSMAKDLELHEHFDIHQNGERCGSEPVECLTKTRVWQTILIYEMMIGGSQGRSDLGVDPNTVDVSTSPPSSDIDDYEKSLSRKFAYFVRNARNIRLITDASQKLKKKKDWGLDPEFVAYNVAFRKWPGELPPDLQLALPTDGSSPKLASHFIGNMHAHYHLGIVMLHRPQLVASKAFANDEIWKQQMSQIYKAAKTLCRVQEAILENFGLAGLLCMARGINFTIYAILTCTMIHLIALTSPDSEFNSDARDFFTRHMRILEQCVSAWTMPDTEAQINALRSAFSEDISRPFELKASFPLGSPSERSRQSKSPSQESQIKHLQIPDTTQYPHLQAHGSNAPYIMTPPVSANDSKPESPQFHQDYIPDLTSYPQATYSHQASGLDGSHWNPTPIIDQFNTAFAIPPAALAPPPASNQYSNIPGQRSLSFDNASYTPQSYSSPYASSTTSYPQQYVQQQVSDYPVQQQQIPQHQMPQQVPQYPQTQYPVPTPIYVSARDWQQSVATVLDSGGLKRRWQYDPHGGVDEQQLLQKRMR